MTDNALAHRDDDSLRSTLTTTGRLVVTAAVGVALLLAGPVVGALLPAGSAEAHPPAATDIEVAIAALIGDRPATALALIPADFAETAGYSPDLEDGLPVNPGGSCSSPIPLPARFEPLCRSHDLGYDLLRYADRRAIPAAPWARAGLDDALVRRMRNACHDPACRAQAELARAGLSLNTWRQQSGPPILESGPQIAVSYAARTAQALAGVQ